MPASVVIVGAGVGGLAAAAVLGRQGVRCVVLERARTLPASGGGIQIAPNGSAVLHRLGLAGALAGAVRPAVRELRRWSDDSLIRAVPLQRYATPYYAMRRTTLCRALARAAARHADLRFGVACKGVEDRGDRVVVRLGDGTRLTADAVVGADGLNSSLRSMLVGDAVRASGFSAFRALLPDISHPPGVVVRLGPGRHIVSYPVDGGVNVVAVVPTGAPLAFEGWHPRVRELLAAGKFHEHRLSDRARPAWGRGRIMLLGDAAHPMLPFLAQGACQALEDAAALAGGGPYPGSRAPRVAAVAAAGLAGARDHHLPDGDAQASRDARIAAGAPSDLDWLYGPQSAPTFVR